MALAASTSNPPSDSATRLSHFISPLPVLYQRYIIPLGYIREPNLLPEGAPTMESRRSGKAVPGSKRERTREKLLDAAAELFQARGVAAVSLDEVAAHAGLTKGAIYGNFESKDDLVFAVTAERTSKAIPIFEGEAPLREQL